jgi:Tfp pilus assembly protein PilN
MIKINLLPEELRQKKQHLGFEPDSLLYLIPLVFGILIVVHIYLAAAGIIAGYQLRSLSSKWEKLEPQRKMVENINKEYTGLTQDSAAVHKLLKERVSWSEKLNLLSLDLPPGIWFNEINISEKGLTVKGSVISLTKQELGEIRKFLDNLEKDKDFFADFISLELGPVQKVSIGSYEVAEFTISGKLK